MLLNIGLLVLLFGAEKKKISPYFAAILLGAVKALIYGLVSHTVVVPLLIGVAYAGLAFGFVFFLKRIDRHEDAERPLKPAYGSVGSQKMSFRWEYVPLSLLLLLIVGGELLLL